MEESFQTAVDVLIISLAILPFLFNNKTLFSKTFFIRKLLNNNDFNAIYVDYWDVNSASGICD